MRFKYRLWGVVAASFCIGVFAGMLLPPVCLVVIEGSLLVFIAFCRMCS